MSIKNAKMQAIILIVFTTLICSALFYIASFLVFQTAIREADKFCTTEDEVYQSINLNLDSWLAIFPTDYTGKNALPMQESINFQVKTGSVYKAFISWPYNANNRLFIVITDHGGPSIPELGTEGYIYSSGHKPPDLYGKYKLTYLANGIYCYQIASSISTQTP
jgi:hypothetical protein